MSQAFKGTYRGESLFSSEQEETLLLFQGLRPAKSTSAGRTNVSLGWCVLLSSWICTGLVMPFKVPVIADVDYENFGTLEETAAVKTRRSRNAKAKGRAFEKAVAELIATKLDLPLMFSARGSGGRRSGHKARLAKQKFNYSVECKNHKALHLPEWIRQAEKEAAKQLIPALAVFKQHGDSTPYVALRFDFFLITVESGQWMSVKGCRQSKLRVRPSMRKILNIHTFLSSRSKTAKKANYQ